MVPAVAIVAAMLMAVARFKRKTTGFLNTWPSWTASGLRFNRGLVRRSSLLSLPVRQDGQSTPFSQPETATAAAAGIMETETVEQDQRVNVSKVVPTVPLPAPGCRCRGGRGPWG